MRQQVNGRIHFHATTVSILVFWIRDESPFSLNSFVLLFLHISLHISGLLLFCPRLCLLKDLMGEMERESNLAFLSGYNGKHRGKEIEKKIQSHVLSFVFSYTVFVWEIWEKNLKEKKKK